MSSARFIKARPVALEFFEILVGYSINFVFAASIVPTIAVNAMLGG